MEKILKESVLEEVVMQLLFGHPRGDYIAFTKFTRGRFFIGLMRPDGSEERLIAEGYLNRRSYLGSRRKSIKFLDKFHKKTEA